MEGDTFDINGRRMFEAETTKYVVINRCGDTVTTREIFMPQATFIGRTKGSAVGGEHYHAVGADFATGEEGGHYECEHGDKVDEPAVATTKIERTERKKGKKVCGVQISGDRTTTHTTTSQQLLQTRYRSLGKLEHHVPEGTHTRTGVVNEAEGELLYHAKHHEGDAAAAVNTQSVATEKTTFLGGSSHSHYQESAAFAPNISRSATRVRFEGDTADLKGEVLQTPEVAEKVKKTFKLGMSKRELAHRSSSSRERVLGAASVDTQGGQDAGLQSAVMGIEGGKVKWFSDSGDSLIFESVIADQIGKMVVKKDFKQETATLNAWQQTTRESSGFSAPILEGKVQDPLVSSVQGLGQSEHAADQAAGMLKAGSEGLKAGMDGFKILQSLKAYNPLDALKTLLGRWTTISLSVNTSESSQRQSVAQPNVLNFEVLVLDNTHSHLEGKISGKTLVALCDKLTTGPMVSTAESHHEERGGGVSANLMTLVSGLPSLNVHEASGHTEQRTNSPTTINVDQLFVRVNHAVFSGTQIRAKLVDAIIKGSLTIESVLDTFRSTHSGLDLSTTGDVRIADQEKVKEKINAIANLVGTQQFYLQVGQTLLTRSAEYGLRPDGTVVDVEKVKTVDGREFYLRPIPEEVDEENEGSLAIALGLSKEEMVPYHQGLEALAQQGRRPKGKGEKKEVRFADAEAAPGALKGKPQAWLSQASSFSLETFLKGIADKKGVRITVWQKQNHEGNVEHLLTVGTEDTDSHKILEVHLYRTDDHYDLLEADPTRVEAASYQTEQLQERDEEDGIVINMPIGTALTLAAQLNELQSLVAQTHAQAKAEGASEEEAVEAVAQVKEVEQELKQAQAELMQAEREAAQKLEVRQKTRDLAKKDTPSSFSSLEREDMSHIDALLQVDTQDQDIIRDLAARQQEIVARHQAALESRTYLEKARDICLVGVEVLKDIGQEIKSNPFGFAGVLAYETADFVTPGGIDAPTEYLRSQRSFASMMARQSANIAAEAATGYVAAKGLKVAGKGLGVLKRFTDKAIAKAEGRWVAKQEADVVLEKLGKAIREGAIPSGSKLEYLAPGRVRFDGVEFRAVRDLGHLSETELRTMLKRGKNPTDTKGIRLDGHHFQQQYHREPGAFIVEIPDPNHCISNLVQHPLGRTGGLTSVERADWDVLRVRFNKERAKTELLSRGVLQQ